MSPHALKRTVPIDLHTEWFAQPVGRNGAATNHALDQKYATMCNNIGADGAVFAERLAAPANVVCDTPRHIDSFGG